MKPEGIKYIVFNHFIEVSLATYAYPTATGNIVNDFTSIRIRGARRSLVSSFRGKLQQWKSGALMSPRRGGRYIISVVARPMDIEYLQLENHQKINSKIKTPNSIKNQESKIKIILVRRLFLTDSLPTFFI